MKVLLSLECLDDDIKKSKRKRVHPDYNPLFRAVLYNIYLGIETGHLSDKFVRGLFDIVTARLRVPSTKTGRRGTRPSVNRAYGVFREELKRQFAKEKFHRIRCAKNPCAHDSRGITVQPAEGFEFWLKSNSGFEKRDRVSERRAKFLVRKFNERISLIQGQTMGHPDSVLWLTVSDENLQSIFSPSYRSNTDKADQIRQWLGLAQYGPGTGLVAFQTRESLPRVLQQVKLCGPTVADAPTHDRYAHWPNRRDTEVVWGMTFHIDGSIPIEARSNARNRDAHNTGAVEYICEPLPLEQIATAALVGVVDDTTTDISDAGYGERLTKKLSTTAVLKKIEKALARKGPHAA